VRGSGQLRYAALTGRNYFTPLRRGETGIDTVFGLAPEFSALIGLDDALLFLSGESAGHLFVADMAHDGAVLHAVVDFASGAVWEDFSVVRHIQGCASRVLGLESSCVRPKRLPGFPFGMKVGHRKMTSANA
jgi:hypothetical protein